jgi:hypothetical protein
VQVRPSRSPPRIFLTVRNAVEVRKDLIGQVSVMRKRSNPPCGKVGYSIDWFVDLSAVKDMDYSQRPNNKSLSPKSKFIHTFTRVNLLGRSLATPD